MTEKKAVKKEIKKDTGTISYILGIISIVMAVMMPLSGLVFGIIGRIQSKKSNDELSKKAKKYNTIGIILSSILLIISLAINIYYTINGLNPFISLQ